MNPLEAHVHHAGVEAGRPAWIRLQCAAGEAPADRSFAEALRAGIGLPRLEGASRDRLLERHTLAMVAEIIGGRVPAGLEPGAPVSSLRTMDLFRFLTVGSMAGYLASLMILKE